MNEEKKKYYYGVVFLKSGDAAVTRPLETEEEVRKALSSFVSKRPHEVKGTTYMIRENENLESVFGHPKSRDLMQDKKFLETL